MKKLVFLTLAMTLGASALGQSRATVLTEKLILDNPPPQSLRELIETSDTAVEVRVNEKKATLDARGHIVVQYTGTVTGSLGTGKSFFEQGDSIKFHERGGVFDNGRIIRQGDTQYYASLEPGASYIVFLNRTPEDEYSLFWGKYGAFQVVSGAIVPLSPSDHPFFKDLAGFYLPEFRARAEAEAGGSAVGDSEKARRQPRP